jgi:hypothetical protein
MPSSVCLRSELVAAGVVSAIPAAGAGAGRGVDRRATGGAEDAGRGAAGTGVGRRGAGSGVDRLVAAGAGVEERAAAARSGVAVAAAVALDCGRRAGAGISSSAPHSESMSSVGGAMEGRGGLALTRSLSDRLSVIALPSPFHGLARKSSAQRRQAL